jgi:hypothetical protein
LAQLFHTADQNTRFRVAAEIILPVSGHAKDGEQLPLRQMEAAAEAGMLQPL